jgi:hypothetical protein
MTIEYRVKRVERFIVTRFEGADDGAVAGSSIRQIGNEFSNADVAYEVGYALARQEAEQNGYGPGDMRMIYPTHPRDANASPHVIGGPLSGMLVGSSDGKIVAV